MRRAAAYRRVSTAGQAGDNRFGLGVQQRAIESYAKSAGFDLVAEFEDHITGTTATRSGLHALVEAAPQFEAVIISSVDRLARRVRTSYAVLDELLEAGLEVHASDLGHIDPDDDSSGLSFGVGALIADQDARRITKRLMGGKLAKMRSGKPVFKLRAYGWKNDQVHATEAAWVNWMYQRALDVGAHTITTELYQQGVPSPTGQARWDTSGVIAMLRDSAYRGEWVFGRIRKDRPAALKVAISAPCPRIVSDELWWAVQRALDHRQTGQGRRGSRTDQFPFQGRITCAECGRAMIGQQSQNARTYYLCGDVRHPVQKQRGCTHRTNYPARQLHQEVLASLRGLTDQGADLSAYLPAPVAQPRDLTPLFADLDTRLRRINDAFEAGIDTLAEYGDKKKRLDAQRLSILNAPVPLVPTINPDAARKSIREALELELCEAVLKLGLRLTVGPGGTLGMTLDPVI